LTGNISGDKLYNPWKKSGKILFCLKRPSNTSWLIPNADKSRLVMNWRNFAMSSGVEQMLPAGPN
jgi:hypothetical protein